MVEHSEVSVSSGEWHKCRRWWRQGWQCPFHPLEEREREDEEPDEKQPVPTPTRQPEIKRPDVVPVAERKKTGKVGGGPDAGLGTGVPVRVPEPLRPVLPTPLLPGRPVPDVDRPARQPVPVGEAQFTGDGPQRLTSGEPIIVKGGLPLQVNSSIPSKISVQQQFEESGRIGGLFLPGSAPTLSGKTDSGQNFLPLGLFSMLEDAQSFSEIAYVRSLSMLQEELGPRKLNIQKSLRERSHDVDQRGRGTKEGPFSSRRSRMAAIAAASAIGVGAHLLTRGRGGPGRGGFNAPGIVSQLTKGFAR